MSASIIFMEFVFLLLEIHPDKEMVNEKLIRKVYDSYEEKESNHINLFSFKQFIYYLNFLFRLSHEIVIHKFACSHAQ
jgi:hypothetical protein